MSVHSIFSMPLLIAVFTFSLFTVPTSLPILLIDTERICLSLAKLF